MRVWVFFNNDGRCLLLAGVYNDPKCDSYRLGYTVLAVGYDTTSDTGEQYWILKNRYYNQNCVIIESSILFPTCSVGPA